MPDYIPNNDDGFQVWALNFATTIATDPPRWGFTIAQSASISAAVDDFVAKREIANTELTRNVTSIADKDDALSVAKSLCRQYAMICKENDGVTPGDKLAIGVRPPSSGGEPIDAPISWPVLNILGNTPSTQTVRFVDSVTNEKAKPYGCSELQLWLAVTDEGEGTLAQAKFMGKYTKNPIVVDFDEADNQRMATYYARWVNPRGQVGPWGVPASMAIAA